jgi:hypothetical protein
MSHLNMKTYDLTPIDALAAEAYGPLVSQPSLQDTLGIWFVASLLLEEAGLVNEDGTVKTTPLMPEELVSRPVENSRAVTKAVESLCAFEASVDALLAAAASLEGDPATVIRQAAIPKSTFSNHMAGIYPTHPAIVRAAIRRSAQTL